MAYRKGGLVCDVTFLVMLLRWDRTKLTSRPHRQFDSSVLFATLDSGDLPSMSTFDMHFFFTERVYCLASSSPPSMEKTIGQCQTNGCQGVIFFLGLVDISRKFLKND